MKRKVCKKCRSFVTGATCPICKSTDFSETWMGRINITNPDKSEIAKKIGMDQPGEYTIKTR